MHLLRYHVLCFSTIVCCVASLLSTDGIKDLVKRRLPNHVDDFSFTLINVASVSTNITVAANDHYTVYTPVNGTIDIQGNSLSALASGLHWYLARVANVDIHWFIGSRLHLASQHLPRINASYSSSSIVPWRYHFNTVTFSYTSAFWTWEDWELQLDWLALRGVNLPLAWVGQEKILYDVFSEAGFEDSEIFSFLSGPAFQAWNRFGNIQGSWNGSLPTTWIDSQFALQKKILKRMTELGMTPVLPCFTGFVPSSATRLYPNASIVDGSQWSHFPSRYTNVTFLEPMDPHFAELQTSFISKQADAYGNISSIYTLDQYNENNPYSGELDYLRNVTYNTWRSLKNADPHATWIMQGWLFYSSSSFWTDERIEAFLSGVEVDSDMLILDLFSESKPQWQRTNSYFGKPWIWCQLHDYGGNMGLYGQVENVTNNPIEAIANSSSLIGFGLTMEGEEGNEIMYDLLLDQAWSNTPLNTEIYFHDWVTTRYGGNGPVPEHLYRAWDSMRTTVYNNTNLTAAIAVTKSIFELIPNTTGLGRIGEHSTAIQYRPEALVQAWNAFHQASIMNPTLLQSAAYKFDLVDVTRQVMANAFQPLYATFVAAANSSLNTSYSPTTAAKAGSSMLSLLSDLDTVLAASDIPHFSLAAWIASARAQASPKPMNSSSSINCTRLSDIAALYEYNARNQITLWGPTGQISDYASKQWGGLVKSYYIPRWTLFVEDLLKGSNGTSSDGVNPALTQALMSFEEDWQVQTWGERADQSYATAQGGDFAGVLASVVDKWPDVFGHA
ncbi:hypothetical protein AAFC00_000006 [Neodothiora populina]|uniref:Alpha-N-acetylglucosaminidase n=1 Tax=Neodothiora populina TaxID=2781224 RepID=A0ABR3P1F0_9PEZI